MLFNFPLPPFPSFLQVDVSDVPALLAAMTLFLGMEPVKGDALKDVIVLGILLFNLVEGVIVMIVTIIVFRNIRVWLTQQRLKYNRT